MEIQGEGITISYTHLPVHLVGDELTGSVEEGGDLSSRRFPEMVDLVQSTYVISFV
jgi:hypothetical protein